MVARTSEERQLLNAQSKELTLRSRMANDKAMHEEVKAKINSLKLKVRKSK